MSRLPRKLFNLSTHTLVTSSFIFSYGLNSNSIQEQRADREVRAKKFSPSINHGNQMLSKERQRESSSGKLDDLRALFCPPLFKKSDSGSGRYIFGAANTGDSDILDYLKSLGDNSNFSKESANFLKVVEKPIEDEIKRYQNLHKSVHANRDAFQDHSSREFNRRRDTYEKARDKREELVDLHILKTQMHEQAKLDLSEIQALGFEVDKNFSAQATDPVMKNIFLLAINSGFRSRLNERTAFLQAAVKNQDLEFQKLYGSGETIQKGESVSLRELFLVGGQNGFKVSEDMAGNYFIAAANEEESKYTSLCNPTEEEHREEQSAQDLLNRILDTGNIKLSEKDCEALRKEIDGEEGDVGKYLADKISGSVEYSGKEAAEILVPISNFSADLKDAVTKATPDLKKNEAELRTAVAKLEDVTRRIQEHLSEVRNAPSASNRAITFDPNSSSVRDREFISNQLSQFEGENVGSSLSELKKLYPTLISERPDLAQAFVEAHHENRIKSQTLESNKVKVQGLANKDFIPLALADDIRRIKTDEVFASIMSSTASIKSHSDLEKPTTSIKSTIGYETHYNKETGNVEIYVCEEPEGKSDQPRKRLMTKPIFTVDKTNIDPAFMADTSQSGSSYNGYLWATLADTLHCPGDPDKTKILRNVNKKSLTEVLNKIKLEKSP